MASPNASAQLTADVYETPGGDAYVLEIPVPGVRPDEILIEVMVSSVTVSTEPRLAVADPGRKYIHREHSLQPMSRILELPMELDTDSVRASLEYGILKICAPIAVAGRHKMIRVGQTV